ncbi:MAG: hypothetical protein SO132_06520 [Candidatus Enteromonas sp.]|nr:hypothetical protein [Mollicutes bacterium]MDY4936400.1 hypothetical protein [Candidatus Enteromonas sp.]
MENAIENINDLSLVLTRVRNKENENDKLAFLIATQLEVIKSINSIGLMTYTVDSVLDLLRDNYYSLASEEDKSFYQMQAANAIQSIFVFGKVRISILRQETANAVNQLAEQGFSLIQNSLRRITQLAMPAVIAYATGGSSTIGIGDNFKKSILNSLKDGSIFAEGQKVGKIFAAVRQKRQARRNVINAENELLDLEQSFLTKTIEYRKYLGDSIVIKELMNEFHYIPELSREKTVHFFKWLLLVGMFALSALCMNATFPNYTPFLVVFSILIGSCLVFQIVFPNVIFGKAKQKKKEFEIAFQQIRDNSIEAEEYASKKNAYIALLNNYSKAKLACDVMGSFFITVGVLVLFAGLSIFLWMIEANAFLSVLAKIGSILSAIVGVVIEIPFLIASFSKIRE